MTTESPISRTVDVVACPACREVRFTSTGRAPGLTCRLGKRDFVQPDYEIRECSRCGLLYRTPNLNGEELAAYYSLTDYRKWEVAGFFPTERAAHAQLCQLPVGARILDFGCSSGRLLAPLVRRYACSGFEINPEAARLAAEKGLVMISPADLDSAACGPFDAIVLSDVFEHLAKPMDLLRKLVGLLKPGGELLIITGNADAPACRLDPAQFWYFRNVEHLCMLNRKYANFLARELGVTLVGWRELSHYDTPLCQRLLQFARHLAYWQLHRGTPLSRIVLSRIPVLNRAGRWPVAPAYNASVDHVLAIYKLS